MGMRPRSMPMFSVSGTSHMPMTPATMHEPASLSDARRPIVSATAMRGRVQREQRTSAPKKKPNCSRVDAEDEVRRRLGRKPPDDCVALPKPLPVISPGADGDLSPG